MLHEPVSENTPDNASKKKARLGIRFFFVYLAFYTGFVLIGVLNYELLAVHIAGGVNLAVFYGMGLIIFAVLLGIVYNLYCSRYEDELNKEEDKA